MLKAREATIVLYKESDLQKLSPKRLKEFKKVVYSLRSKFYCESCREYHVDMMDAEEKKQYDQLGKNIDLISKVQSLKASSTVW